MTGLFLGVAMLAVFALLSGAVVLRRRDRRKSVLMAVCALVILGNVLIIAL